MVYVPWANYGICKYWMVQRCHDGSDCRWKHPAPPERKRLWNEHTAKQREDEKRGIPPPQPPPKKTIYRGEKDAGPYGPDNAPPPPPPPPRESAFDRRAQDERAYGPDRVPPRPPPSSPSSRYVSAGTERYDSSGPRDSGRAPPPSGHPVTQDRNLSAQQGLQQSNSGFVTLFQEEPRPSRPGEKAASSTEAVLHSSRAVIPTIRAEPPSPEMDNGKTKSNEVSMLDAPPSPKKVKENKFQPLGNANREPLGKNNRIRDESKDTNMVAGTWAGSWSAGKAKENENENEKDGGLVLSSDLPSGEAITVWKRSDANANTAMTEDTEPVRQGGYWERRREWQAAQKKTEEEQKAKKLDGTQDESLKPQPTMSRENELAKQIQRQTSLVALSQSGGHKSALKSKMGATKRLSNGETKHVGPHPSTIRVSAPYMTQSAVEKKLQPPAAHAQFEAQERSIAEAREDSMRLQGCTWIDNVRRALQLPIRTYTTACVYYHKFRLAHPGNLTGMEYGNAWADACAASLLTSCKVEDTLKKSRDILAAAYNLKASTHDQLGSDDAMFEAPSRAVIGLERMVLEAGGFDFRSKYPHRLLVKIVKTMPEGADGEREKVSKVAWSILTDLHRTFAPLKQTSATLALASLELAAHLVAASSPNNVSAIRDELQQFNIQSWSTSREEIMETLLDALDLYTQHTANTVLGTKYSLDDFLRIRLAFNKECSESNLPRYTTAPPSDRPANGSTLRVANGHPTPVSPPQPGAQAQGQQQNATGPQAAPEGGGTLRFMLNPQLAADEKTEVQKYFVEEWEEYEEEIEVPALPRPKSRERERPPTERPLNGRPQDVACSGDRSDKDASKGKDERNRDRDREKLKDREREIERERARVRERRETEKGTGIGTGSETGDTMTGDMTSVIAGMTIGEIAVTMIEGTAMTAAVGMTDVERSNVQLRPSEMSKEALLNLDVRG